LRRHGEISDLIVAFPDIGFVALENPPVAGQRLDDFDGRIGTADDNELNTRIVEIDAGSIVNSDPSIGKNRLQSLP